MNVQTSKPHQIRWSDIRNLLIRKLRQKKREQTEQFFSEIQSAYAGLRETIRSDLQLKKAAKEALSPDLLATYRSIVGIARLATKVWPETVWATTTAILEHAHLPSIDSTELNGIIDRFAWAPGQEPFTLEILDAKRFRERVNRETRRHGLDQKVLVPPDDAKLTHAAALAHIEVLNLARLTRESIGIAVDEYVVANSHINLMMKTPTTDDDVSEHDRFAIFRKMENLAWKDIKITVDPEREGLRISAKGEEIRVRLAALPGLGRKDDCEFNAQGKLFLNLAAGDVPAEIKGLDAAFKRLSKLLKLVFGLKPPPFRLGQPQFLLSVPKDEEAKKRASSESMPFDDNKSASPDDDPLTWLEKKDPKFDPKDPLYSEE